MERLTERVYDGLIIIKQDSGDEGNYKAADKLATYEDLEEQGLLVRLPCKVGDTVYKFWYYDRSPYKIQQHVIRTLSEICELIESKKLGKSVFLTREEAVNKLEEMKNG